MSEYGLFALRPYQEEIASAIASAVLMQAGLSFSVLMPRQSGKNEISVRLQLRLLAYLLVHGRVPLIGVKAAPIGNQVNLSARRLEDRLNQAGFREVARRIDGYKVRLGDSGIDFLSAEPTADNAGHTASLMLECDEAQDVDVETFDKTFMPMAASTNAPRIYYGTSWTDDSLLELRKQEHLAAERRDGIRRHFEVPWERVADEEPSGSYRRYVEGERERLGADHPLFATQYGLKTLAALGRLFKPVDLATMAGSHARLSAPVSGDLYVAGLDVGGSAEFESASAALRGHDSTVLTIGRVVGVPGLAGEELQALQVVTQYAWTGAPTEALYGQVLALLGTWRVQRLVVDATGLGEPLAAYLVGRLGRACEGLKLTQQSKSEIGYGLLGLVMVGRLQLWAAEDTPDYQDLRGQLELARVQYLPSRLMRFWVDEAQGHDDRLISVALAVRAMRGAERRVARGTVVEL